MKSFKGIIFCAILLIMIHLQIVVKAQFPRFRVLAFYSGHVEPDQVASSGKNVFE